MTKKIYIQPTMEIDHWTPMHALCASLVYGGNSTNIPGEDPLIVN